jgi:manganese/iron transport system permease protein/iron/zinc/copper transport system permease protein
MLINSVARRRKIGADAAIGVVTTASFAIGVALVSHVHKFTINFDAALFGNILGVRSQDLIILACATAFVVAIVFFRYRQLLFLTFDPDVADAYGVNTRRYDTLFALILAVTVVATMQLLGVTLIAAIIVVPAIISRLVTDSFGKMLIVSAIVGALCSVVGVYISYYNDVASGATIVLVAAALFIVVFSVTALTSRRRLSRLGEDHTSAEIGGGPTVHVG